MKASTQPSLTGVVFLALLAALFTLISPSTPIAHAGAVCTSQGSGAWSAISWDCGAPGANDDVIIAAGNVVTVDAPVSVQQITIQAGATLRAGALPNKLTANGDVTVDGNLTDDGNGASSVFNFNGATFTNDSVVTGLSVSFATDGAAKTQIIAGTGTWTGDGYLRIGTAGASRTAIVNSLTMGMNLQTNINGSVLDIGANNLTIDGKSFDNAHVHGAGTLRFQDSSDLYVFSIDAPIDVLSGTTLIESNVWSPLPGPLTVSAGATLNIGNGYGVFVLGDVIINGTLSQSGRPDGEFSGFFFRRGTLTNNGMITAPAVTFDSYTPGAILTLAGTGTWSGQRIMNVGLGNPTTVLLADSVTLPVDARITVYPGSVLDVGTHTLTLQGGVGSGGRVVSAPTGTVVYARPYYFQDVFNGDYGNLIFKDGVEVVKYLPWNGLIRIAGVFDPGTVTFVQNGCTIEYNGSLGQTMPAAITTYDNLTINNPGGMTGVSGLTVNGLLHVAAGTFTSASAYHDVQVDAGATLALADDITVSGDFVINGALAPAGHTVTFNGGTAQNLTLNAPVTFANLTVGAGTTLVETVAVDNATVSGALVNQGVIRKAKPVLPGDNTFGLADVTMQVVDAGSLASVQVDRVDGDHPHATGSAASGVKTGRYWAITPDGSGYAVELTLPHDDLVEPTVCRYIGSAWDCARSGFDATTVTRAGIAQLSDWAVGADIRPAVIPSVTVGRDEHDLTLSWPPEDADSDGYLVWYHAVDPYFEPGAGDAVSVNVLPPGGHTHGGVIGDGQCYFYLVQGRNGAGVPSGVSARTGKFDFSLVPGQ